MLALSIMLALLAIGSAGCDGVRRPPLNPVSDSDLPRSADLPASDDELLEAPGTPFDAEWESWDVYQVRDQPVGYLHVDASRGSNSTDRVIYSVDHGLAIRRGAATLIQRLSQRSVETELGALLSFESQRHFGPSQTTDTGVVDSSSLKINHKHGGEQIKYELPWQPSYRGLVGVEQSLRRNPIGLGQTRVLKMPILYAGRYQIATVRLRCEAEASVPMLDGKPQRLFEVESETQVGDSTIRSTIWADGDGNVLRTYSPTLRMFAYRVDAATAKRMTSDIDWASTLAIEIEGKLPAGEQFTRVAYVLSRDEDERSEQFTLDAAPGQFVRQVDGTWQVLVSRRSETLSSGFAVSTLEPSEDDLNPSNWINSGDTAFGQLVSITLTGEADLGERATALMLADTANTLFSERSERFGGFRPASEIMESESGDSTEQSMVLMALLRAQKIPARLATGLVYQQGSQPRMVYGSWVLAFVDGQWLPLDPLTGTVAGPDRITLGTTSLAGDDPYAAINRVITVADRLRIKIVRAQ